jgi:hypothetical protein
MPVRDREWIKRFRAELEDDDFRRLVLSHLDRIRSAAPKDRPAEAASFGGLLRSLRCRCRINLAQSLIGELKITPTLHVAKYVMRQAFGEAAANTSLQRNFAQSGRDATEKYMNAARRTVVAHPALIEQHSRLYEFYCNALKRAVKKLKQ